MPTDPQSANQSNPPAPLGQAQPPAQQLPQQSIPYQFQQRQQPHIPIHPAPPANALQHPQYALSQNQMHSMPQVQAQRQPGQQPQAQQPRTAMSQQDYFTVNGYQHLNSYPGQPYQMSSYMYTSPPPYPYTMPGTNGPPQQPPVNSRAQRQFPHSVASNPPHRSTPRTNHVPLPRKKNILQIVDPDTNEEVKVSKVETRPVSAPVAPAPAPHTPVKIPQRKSRALELVSDPADESKGGGTATSSSAADKSVDVAVREDATASDEQDLRREPLIEPQSALTGRSPLSHEQGARNGTTIGTEISTETEDVQTKNNTAELVLQEPRKDATIVVSGTSVSPAAERTSQSVTKKIAQQGKPPVEELHLPEAEVTVSDVPSSRGVGVPPCAVGEISGTTSDVVETGSGVSDSPNIQAPPTVSETNKKLQPHSETSIALSGEEDPVLPPVAPSSVAPTRSEQVNPTTLIPVASEIQPTSNTIHAPLAKSPTSTADMKGDTISTSTGSELASKISEKTSDSPSTEEATVSADMTDVGSQTSTTETPVASHPPLFAEGERRVYVPAFMWNMKSMPNAKRSTEYEASLGSSNILKNGSSSTNSGRNEPRGSRSTRGGGGPLSTDPRRAFPGQGAAGFQMAPMRSTAPPGIGGVGVGPYDAFDLRSARSQAPPPVPKGQTSVRDGDPRGTKQQGSRGRFDGPTRRGQTPVDPFIIHAPVEKLKKSEHGWKRNRDADDEVTTKVKSVRSLLNKLTLEKFEKIFKLIVDVGISSFEILDGVVNEIFEKTLFEPKFSGMYAELCRRLEVALRDVLAKASVLDPDGKPITFRKILLNHCRDEFTRFAQSGENSDDQAEEKDKEEAAKKEAEEDEKLTPKERAAKAKMKKGLEEREATNAKRRMLANVGFIAELFLKQLLREQIIHKQCILKLLKLGIENKEEDILEALCKLISKTGAKLSENKDAIDHIDSYFVRLQILSMDHTLPARIRFMLQDLLEQRRNNWKVRREEVGAKTIAEIHKDIEKEERAKQEAQAAARDRKNRGGGMHGRDRGQQNFAPRVAMTMASRRSGPNVSRTNSVIEKFGNRGASSVPNNNLQSYRLGPSGARTYGAGSGGSAPLRPGARAGMFGPFSALMDNKDSGLNGQTGDARRSGKAAKLPSSSRRAPAKVQSKPPDKVKEKTKSLLKEFWSVGLLEEVQQCLVEEIRSPKYDVFVEEAIKISLDGRVEESEKSIGLLRDLTLKPLSSTHMVSGFSSYLSQLGDLAVDNPRAAEFLGKYIGAVASTKKLPGGSGPSFGLEFVIKALSESEDPKRVTTLIVSLFSTLQKELVRSISIEEERTRVVRNAYLSLDVDVAGLMNSWNPMRGLSSLEDMLKSNGLAFLAPHIKLEESLKAVLRDNPADDKVLDLLKSCATLDDGLMRVVTRESLDWILMAPPGKVREVFSSVIGAPLLKAFGTEISKDVQMASLLEAQFYVTKNMAILPLVKTGSFEKPGSVAFDALYDAELVSKETFVQWKEDTGRSLRVPGKDKMVIQTSQFFQWLAQLQQ